MAAILGDPEDVVVYLREVHVADNELVVDRPTKDEKISLQSREESEVR